MMRFLLIAGAALGLSACATQVPNSGAPSPGAGVGFGDYNDYQAQREAQLTGGATTVQGPVAVQETPLDDADAAARQQATQANSGVPPVNASPANPPPQALTNAVGISNENNFDAVSAQRDIEDDAALIAANRAQYVLVTPTDLPVRSGSTRPNIVEYALRTNNPVGTQLYKRSSFRAETKYRKSCGAFASADLAQEEFLALGGPQKDRKGMDPDGDGFACGWNPAPFRAVRSAG